MKTKKSLGQNFLKSGVFAQKIANESLVKENDIVLEIGPGKGILTQKILEKKATLIAVEKDENLCLFLSEKFEKEIGTGQLKIICGDILKKTLKELGLEKKNYKIIANIPYYITGVFLRRFLSQKNQPEKMILMLQKEVASRIVAKNKKESLLSLSVKSYGEVRIIKKVPAKYFSPPPKVDSAIMAIENIGRNFFIQKNLEEERFFSLIKKGFSSKRKYLIRNLTGFFSSQEKAREVFKACGIPEKARAEDVPLEKWGCLSKN